MSRTAASWQRNSQKTPVLSGGFGEVRMPGLGRQHSATNGCFREVKNQRPLFGDELEEMSVAFRPLADVASVKNRSLRTFEFTGLRGFSRSPVE